MSIWSFHEQNWNLMFNFQNFFSHSLAVKRIKFGKNQDQEFQVATCSDDHTVRIF